jgi:hypothetical protein
MFKHKDIVTLYYRSERIEDAKISKEKGNNGEELIYICHNNAKFIGNKPQDILGYSYSFQIEENRPLDCDSIRNMAILGRKPTKEEIEYLETSYDNTYQYQPTDKEFVTL